MRLRRMNGKTTGDRSLLGDPSLARLLRYPGRFFFSPDSRQAVAHILEGTVVKRLFVAIVCLVGLVASTPAQAASIVPTSDTVLGNFAIDFVGGTQTLTITGAALGDVVDGAVVNSGIVSADAVPGTTDALFFDLVDEALQFDFNLATQSGLGTGMFTVLAAGTPLTAINDPSLAEFLVPNNTALFLILGEPVFTFDPQTQAPLSALFTYSLESITSPTQVQPIPEPATMGLVGMGILAAARSRHARRKKNVA
jgi:hypothetical protein